MRENLFVRHINRVKALGTKDNLDKLLKGLDAGNDSLSDLEEKLQGSLDLIKSVRDDLTQVGSALAFLNNPVISTKSMEPAEIC